MAHNRFLQLFDQLLPRRQLNQSSSVAHAHEVGGPNNRRNRRLALLARRRMRHVAAKEQRRLAAQHLLHGRSRETLVRAAKLDIDLETQIRAVLRVGALHMLGLHALRVDTKRGVCTVLDHLVHVRVGRGQHNQQKLRCLSSRQSHVLARSLHLAVDVGVLVAVHNHRPWVFDRIPCL
ncbi:hypothetical protein LPJ57_004581, partial [Coemansia sp. RSA 486]